VEAPAFLFTRIKQKIDAQSNDYISSKLGFLYRIAIIFVLLVNVFVLTTLAHKNVVKQNLAQSMHIITNNELYHE
jgi:hypothetical protein